MIYLFPTLGGSPLAPVFEFDGVLAESRTDAYQWSKAPVENAGDVSEHGWTLPKQFSASGLITATPLGLPRDGDRLQRIHDALVKLADAKQPVTLVIGSWVVDVVIARVRASRGESEGEALMVAIDFQTVSRPTPKTVQIPASRLRKDIRRKAGPGKTGGASAGQGLQGEALERAKKWQSTVVNQKQPYAVTGGGFGAL